MNNLETSLSNVFAIGAFVLIVSLYQWSGWRWKTNPWIPFALGVAILFGASLLDWRVESGVEATKANMAAPSTAEQPQRSQMLNTFAKVGGHQLKLLELVAIPLAVSLIVAVVLLRVDREFSLQVSEYSKARHDLRTVNDAAKATMEQLEQALAEGLRGQELLDLHKDALFRQKIALLRFVDLDDRFAKLVSARAVPGFDGDAGN